MDIEQVLTQVRTAATDVDDSLAAVAAARQALHREALLALLTLDGDAQRQRDLVRALYWEIPELPVKTLEAAVGTAAQVRDLAAPGPPLGPCRSCRQEIRATSRTQLAKGADCCQPCEAEARRLERGRMMRDVWSPVECPAPPHDWHDYLEEDVDEFPHGW